MLHGICHIERQGGHGGAYKLLSFLMVISITCMTEKFNPDIVMS
jgi:hypothetical protein